MGRRHFQWRLKKCPRESSGAAERSEDERDEEKTSLSFVPTSSYPYQEESAAPTMKRVETAVSRLRSALTGRRKPAGLGARVTGTLYGHRRGHVQLAFQANGKSGPVVLVELATATTALVREMASGLVRIALECERRRPGEKSSSWASASASASAVGTGRLVEEPLWRAYINGKKCGYAVRRECGAADWKVLRAVEPVSMGAGVIPSGDGDSEKDVMYMRARFERVVGSKDSEAFYMMNPDGNGGPELSVYLLRV